MKTETSIHLFVLPILITHPWGEGLSLIKESSLYMGIPALVWPLGIQNNKTTSDNQSRQQNNVPGKHSFVAASFFCYCFTGAFLHLLVTLVADQH